MAKKLFRAGLIVSTMTLLSRVLGLVRDVVVAKIVGAEAAADVFFFANKIPNFLRRLFAEGAFAQAFIPVLTEVVENEDEKRQKEFVAKVSGTLGIILFFTAIIGVVLSPVITALFGFGWFLDYYNDEPDGEKFVLAATLLKITFPYILFISLTGFAGAILNTLNKFAVSSFTPVLLNVSIIGCAYAITPYVEEPAFALAWGVFVGGVVQLSFQIPFLYRSGMLVRPKWGWSDNYVTKVRKLMIPALFGVSVSQINLLLDTLIASFLVTGSISWLYYSDRLLEFPLGLFGIAIATVILPSLAKNHVQNDAKTFSSTMDWALKFISLLGIPAAAGLCVLAFPLLLVIFQRGAFEVSDASMATFSLMAYGCGLYSFMLVKIFAPAFYSRQDTKTPVKYGIITMVVNMVFNLILAVPFGYVGLAMATAISGSLNALLLYLRLNKLGVYTISKSTWVFIVKVAFATVIMSALVLWWNARIDWALLTFVQRVENLSVAIGLGVVAYLISLLILGIKPWHLMRNQSANN
ncbi:murein biosynthesis integral membrane protein MurJ [Glaciecola sp. 1036]|uniref:murein biosynthesis integral membrane protein MurJ n=1 Tax=Alteromonadaceae TaxID=72275 RepID=UPI003CFE2286